MGDTGPLIWDIVTRLVVGSLCGTANSENSKIYTARMHPFRSVNMFFPQFMQTQSFRFDQPNREWMLLKLTLTAFNGRIAQLVCTQMFWC
jgi:hypothetical protein